MEKRTKRKKINSKNINNTIINSRNKVANPIYNKLKCFEKKKRKKYCFLSFNYIKCIYHNYHNLLFEIFNHIKLRLL